MSALETFEIARAVLPAPVVEQMAHRIDHLPRATPMTHDVGPGVWLKRDDLGELGTHKSRGLSLQIMSELARGARGFSISSSGNAALAAAGWSRRLGATCLAFLSDKTPTAKIEAVAQTGAPTIVTAKPKNLSRYAARYAGLADLRPSRHPLGAMGYRLLAAELILSSQVLPSSIFCFCNSGLTIAGLREGFDLLVGSRAIAVPPQLHAVQCCERGDLAARVGAEVRLQVSPVAGALGARVPPDLERVSTAIENTGGSVWMMTNEEVRAADDTFRRAGIDGAIESAAAYAGFERARDLWRLGDNPVVVVAGRRFAGDADTRSVPGVHFLDDYGQVRELLHELGFSRVGAQ